MRGGDVKRSRRQVHHRTRQAAPGSHPSNSSSSSSSRLRFPAWSMASSSKATFILLIYGILMHYSVSCTPLGLSYPKIRLDNDAFDEDGNSLGELGFDGDHLALRSAAASFNDDGGGYALYYPTDKRAERHAEEELDRALREILGQLTTRHYLHSLMTMRAGEDNSMEDESEPLSKRHSDGIFTDSYSRYRKQMAVQKYLAAVLGRRYRQRVRTKGRRLAYL
ncbi:adenylate cyclase activating polypeptide 1b isoform X2 [Hippocampus comes]|uniref:adenylate cyclase activating polypeptide 1b isoform X2 n=1 Tax=Hippocampus comes TaxID=109280 RepID=UPI00094E2DC6|nr:PREDICTED: glucagon family neuropeptides-like isoform X2 [Hippocampus comes]